ncbi:MAG: hypothetical protein KAI47_19510, partial [Deltaproteobacteria bacterium]|nr:hypothetical protein [Deltaproteobacteria bacterium]
HLPRLGTIVTRLLGTLPETAQVKLIPFDYLPRPLGALSHMAPATPARQRAFDDALRALQPDRGSAFSTVFELAQVDAPSHIVLITDGATAGHQAELEHVLRGLVDHPGAAVSVLLVAPKAPTADLLRDLCRVSGGRFLPVDTDTTLSTLTLARLARLAPPPHPSTAQGPLEIIRVDTDSLLVAGQAPRDARHVKIAIDATHHLRLDLPKSPGDPAATSSTSRAPRSLWAAARIDSLFRQIKLFGESQTLRRRIVALSKTNRVASEYTAFLVTETDADYKRPTSGRLWQRKVHRVADNIPPHFNATPEPHEWALIALGLLLIAIMSRRRDALNS